MSNSAQMSEPQTYDVRSTGQVLMMSDENAEAFRQAAVGSFVVQEDPNSSNLLHRS